MKGDTMFDLEAITEAMDSQCGFCIECGAERGECEPDATEYPCPECGELTVYGAEELLIMGLVN